MLLLEMRRWASPLELRVPLVNWPPALRVTARVIHPVTVVTCTLQKRRACGLPRKEPGVMVLRCPRVAGDAPRDDLLVRCEGARGGCKCEPQPRASTP